MSDEIVLWAKIITPKKDEVKFEVSQKGIGIVSKTKNGDTSKVEKDLKPDYVIFETFFPEDDKCLKEDDILSESLELHETRTDSFDEAKLKLQELRESNTNTLSDYFISMGIFSKENEDWFKEKGIDEMVTFMDDPIAIGLRATLVDNGVIQLSK